MKTFPTLLIILLLLARINFADAQPCRAGVISAQKDSICSGVTARLTVTGSLGSIQWQREDSATFTFSNIIGATDTTYMSGPLFHDAYFRLIVKADSICADTSMVSNIIVVSHPIAQFTYDRIGKSVSFNSDSSKDETDFFWDFTDGSTSTVANPVHQFNDTISIAHVCLTIENQFHCTFTLCQNIILFNIHVNNISEYKNKFSIFPDPCTACFIEGAENENDIVVNDITGRRMNVTIKKAGNGLSLTIPNAATGIYFVRNIKTGQVAKFVRAD